MNIPKTVKIGGYDYVVERVKGSFPSGDLVCDGTHTASQTLIRVSDEGNLSYQETTFYMNYVMVLFMYIVAKETTRKSL